MNLNEAAARIKALEGQVDAMSAALRLLINDTSTQRLLHAAANSRPGNDPADLAYREWIGLIPKPADYY